MRYPVGAGIWCGVAFVIAGVLIILPSSSSVLSLRRVTLILSMIFALFFAFWAFIGAFPALFLNANIDVDHDYNKNRWLRITQGFCAIFEIILARVTPKSKNLRPRCHSHSTTCFITALFTNLLV